MQRYLKFFFAALSAILVALGEDLFSSIRGVSYQKSDASSSPSDGLIPVLRANNIAKVQIITDDLVYVPSRYVSSEQYLKDGDILIAASSGSRTVVGKAARADQSHDRFAFGAFCTVARPRISEFSRWLSCYMNSRAYRDYVEQVALGININNLRGSDLKAMPIQIAPLAEQRRIAAKIDSLTAKSKRARDNLDHIPRLVEKYKQSILAAAFRGELTREWRAAIANKVASEWSKKPFADVCDPLRPITYGVIKLGSEIPNGVPCLRTSNVRWLRVDTEKIKRISSKLSSEYARTILRGGEVLVNVRGTLGGVAVATPSMTGWNVSREVAVAAVNAATVEPNYVAFWIGADARQRWLNRVEKGVAYTGINLEDLRKLPIEYPSMGEQREIVRRIEIAFAWIDRLASEATSARELIDHLDQAILAKAFRGELVPQDPNDEPASLLLKRIRATRAAAPVESDIT